MFLSVYQRKCVWLDFVKIPIAAHCIIGKVCKHDSFNYSLMDLQNNIYWANT